MNLINNKPTIRFISDLHLGHKNIYKFTSSVDPSRCMREFDSMEECEKVMVENYNKVVRDEDIVYFLGDIWFDLKHADVLRLMKKGSKRLVMGNHDNKRDVTNYRKYFDKVHGVLYLNKLKAIVSHIPIHPTFLKHEEYSGTSRFNYNIHGHCHDSYVMTQGRGGKLIKDFRYINVSVEAINYTPISVEELGLIV
jgi:calcineurin-like phosphoesterase family protein